MRVWAAVTGGIGLLFIGAFAAGEIWERFQVDKLGVVIYVTDEVIEKGGVVSILTRTVPADEFVERYPVPEVRPEVPGAPSAERQWYGTISGPVNMVFFEIPDSNDYTYRFRALPKNGVAEASVPERVLSIGGTTFDVDGNDMSYVQFGITRSHEITGFDNARAWTPHTSDYEETSLICEETGEVRTCVPTDDALIARAEYLSKSTPTVEVKHPWEQ